MKLLILLLISFPVFSRTLILDKHVVSGYVLPEHSFVKDCKIYSDGTLESVAQYGNGTGDGFSKILKKRVVLEIRALNRAAKKGQIEEGPALCDAGTEIVNGYVGTKKVLLLSAPDCDIVMENKSRAARHLRKLAEKLCAF